jgi:uncharacterized membrane protein YgcG
MLNLRSVRRTLGFMVVAGALVAASAAPASAAKGVPGPPHPPGDEGGEEGGNNLSVPALFVPDTTGAPFLGTCTTGDDSVDPAGVKGVDLDGDGIPDEHLDYWVQGVATWQADCDTAAADNSLLAGAEWGDNLQNAPLKAGTPIRTEIGFFADPAAFLMPGYVVDKLDPTLLDRESHYGTLGAEVAAFPEVRVWNSGVTLDIRSTDGTVVVADNIPFGAEVNSTGRIVYGFNWQKPVAGEYVITVRTNGIALGSTDAGTLVDGNGDGYYDTVTLDVNVGNKGGGNGNGKGGRPGDRPGGGGGGRGGGGHRN